MVTLEKHNFEKIVNSDNVVLVDCWAEWSAACSAFAPTFERIAWRYPNHIFGKLDTQSQLELVATLEIENIPSLLLYRNGVLLLKQPGYLSEEQIEDIVRRAESKDLSRPPAKEPAKNRGKREKAA